MAEKNRRELSLPYLVLAVQNPKTIHKKVILIFLGKTQYKEISQILVF